LGSKAGAARPLPTAPTFGRGHLRARAAATTATVLAHGQPPPVGIAAKTLAGAQHANTRRHATTAAAQRIAALDAAAASVAAYCYASAATLGPPRTAHVRVPSSSTGRTASVEGSSRRSLESEGIAEPVVAPDTTVRAGRALAYTSPARSAARGASHPRSQRAPEVEGVTIAATTVDASAPKSPPGSAVSSPEKDGPPLASRVESGHAPQHPCGDSTSAAQSALESDEPAEPVRRDVRNARRALPPIGVVTVVASTTLASVPPGAQGSAGQPPMKAGIGEVSRGLTQRTVLRREARQLRKKRKKTTPYQWAACEFAYGDMRA
jgi:hypothetical protein